MIPSRARAMCATSRKRIGVLALSGTVCVTRLARQHGASRKLVRAQRERVRLAVDEAFAESVSAPLAEPFARVRPKCGASRWPSC